MSKEMVKRPDHYCFSKFEPKDVIREWGLNFNLGSAVKYIARAGRKDDIVQDLKKANIFKLRAVGVTGKPHPQMLEVMVPLLEEVKKQIPVVFDDLVTE